MSKILSTEALERLLASRATPLVRFYNEVDPVKDPDDPAPNPPTGDKLEDLQNQLLDVNQKANNIQARADAEKRSLTDEEEAEIEALTQDFEMLEAEIDRRQRLIAQNARLADPTGRKTEPDDVQNKAQGQRKPRVPAAPRNPDEVGKNGFRSFGEFAMSVKNAVRAPVAGIDPRLISNAPTTVGTEGVGEDGGFAVPPDFRREIMQKVVAEDSLLARTDQQTSGSNQVTVPVDETTAWQSTGGVQAYWEGENSQFTQSKPALDNVTVRLNKVTALVPVTSELLEDAPMMSSYLRRKVPEKIDFKVNDALINGTGAGQPKGILQSDALVSVAKESGQAADTIQYLNIVNMWGRLYAPCRSRAIWLVHQDLEAKLPTMEFPSTAGTFPTFLPAGGLSQSPFATLMGRPIVPTQACPVLGDKGDIILADMTQYLSIMKVGGVRQDVSMHLWFDYDTLAFRFILRVGGQAWWKAAIDQKNGTNTLSCFVTLDERA